jgi:DNA-directed RNA polymerase specialized sigma24 family protein
MEEIMVMTTLYNNYKSGRMGRKVFEAKLMGEITCQAPLLIKHGKKKDCSDFLSWLYPRIHRAIDNYRYTGNSFDTYIHSIIRKAHREFVTKAHYHFITEHTVWVAKTYEKVSEMEYRYTPDPEEIEKAPPFAHVSNPRQILILMLKSYCFLTDDFIDRIAPALGMSREHINMLVMELRDLRTEREQEIRNFRERIHAQFYRCLSFQYRANSAPAGSARQRQYLKCFDRGIRRLESMRSTMRSMSMDASNQDIADVLGISKGTVDATLYILKNGYPKALSGRSTSAPSI